MDFDARFCIAADNCKYVKGAWSECDPKTNMRTRSFTLKKGDAASCDATRTIEKKCKKGKSGKVSHEK
jgi:PTN/MK heparin-binding protein family, C-terminal domain